MCNKSLHKPRFKKKTLKIAALPSWYLFPNFIVTNIQLIVIYFRLFSLCFYFIFTTNHSATEVDVQSRALNLGRQGHFEISRYCHNLKFLPA
jgi:hypothetical protein